MEDKVEKKRFRLFRRKVIPTEQATIEEKKRIKMFHHYASPGTAPGTLIAHPDLLEAGIRMQLIAYSETDLIELDIKDPNVISEYLGKYPVTWLNVIGLGDVHILQQIAKIFNFHALAMEDVANVHQRPKIEEYDSNTFGVTRIPQMINKELILSQFSFFWGDNYVVTFAEAIEATDSLNPIRARIKHEVRRKTLLRPDYLTYAILDTIIDSYFPIIEEFGNRLDDIEEDAIAKPSSRIVVHIHNFKSYLMMLRRVMWSQREALRNLVEIGSFADRNMKFFLRDCEDHTIQLIDILETYRERTSGLMDVYLSSISNKMNISMKILTAIATIFMPLTFITGLYGMNFDRTISPWNMPELEWYYGYPYVLCVITITALSLGIFFWRKGWFKHQV